MADDAKKALALRQEFGAQEMRNAEMAGITLAARARAEVDARFIMAERHPRDWDDVRIRVLKECKSPSFALESRYKIPNRGEGFTIRFAEALVQHMGNVYAPSYTVFEDETKRLIKALVVDLQRNVTWEKEITVPKTIERKDSKGYEVVGQRIKKNGDIVFIVLASDEELATKEASAVSKAQRTNIMRMCPPDLRQEAKQQVQKTLSDRAAADPEAERKTIADAFASLNIEPSHLKEFLGCELSQVQPAELVELRALYNSLREGLVTWRDLMADSKGGDNDDAKDGDGGGSLADRIRSRMRTGAGAQSEAGTKDAKAGTEAPKAETKAATPETRPPATDTKPPQGKAPSKVDIINGYREGLGAAKWFQILGADGFEDAEMVPADKQDEILSSMDLALRAKRSKEASAQPPASEAPSAQPRSRRANNQMDTDPNPEKG